MKCPDCGGPSDNPYMCADCQKREREIDQEFFESEGIVNIHAQVSEEDLKQQALEAFYGDRRRRGRNVKQGRKFKNQ